MKSYVHLLFLGVCLFTSVVSAQKISGKITYVNTLKKSLYLPGNSDKIDTSWLYFNDTVSAFVIDTKIEADPIMINEKLKTLNVGSDEIQRMSKELVDLYNSTRFQYSYRPNGEMLYYRPWVTGTLNFCRIDSLPDFNWELQSDTMRILGFLCQKATSKMVWEDGFFRQFTAWFTLEIPLSYGPRNVFGLPGIVLNADSKYHSYSAVSVQLPLEGKDIIALSKCKELPLISATEADKKATKMREDLKNMQKLKGNNP
jgi:GLPGLI family protein